MVSMTSTLKQRERVSASNAASRLNESGDSAAKVGGSIEETVAIWQRRSTRQLSREDGREIAENAIGFFRVLQEWDRADRAEDDKPIV
jgi:hypothetical protein